ncbi:hypothetical protein CDCA_CDCA12G3474 [Cyanidium caldarium]|uniref:ERCC4 domain-containing protein n=1 Tax=Cyanidium caldarium TaxID=2771 RepID=A0AAV9IYW9_CYACA|nr:hypothetical protein CDCA_CDCA12G3474 [Cyanidium caldarium]
MGPVLQYQERALENIVAERTSLTVLGRGLDVAGLVALLVARSVSDSDGRAILALNFPRQVWERIAWYVSQEVPQLPLHLLPRRIDAEASAAERMEMYCAGGLVAASARTLAVDLLSFTGDADAEKSGACPNFLGLLVYDAHTVSERQGEAFVAQLFRRYRRQRIEQCTWVHAFSDEAEALCRGFHQVERLMRLLGVERLYLYPRFHMDVVASLPAPAGSTTDTDGHASSGVEVIELHQPLTSMMRSIQDDLMLCLRTCIAELRRSHPSLDVEDSALDAALHRPLASSFRQQLMPLWHRLGSRTRQLIHDVYILQRLLMALLEYDGVTFWELLETLRATEGTDSFWMMTEAAQRVFAVARARVYPLGESVPTERVDKTMQAVASDSTARPVQAVLEENSKWTLLRQVLQEVRDDLNVLRRQDDHLPAQCLRVVVVVRDSEVMYSLSQAMSAADASRRVLEDKYQRHCRKWRARVERAEGEEKGAATEGDVEDDGNTLSDGEKTLEVQFAEDVDEEVATTRSDSEQEQVAPRKNGGVDGNTSTDTSRRRAKRARRTPPEAVQAPALRFDVVDDCYQIVFQCAGGADVGMRRNGGGGGGSASSLLDFLCTYQPSVVVLYDPTLRHMREVEVYQAGCSPFSRIRLYLLLYEDSLEAQRFRSSVEEERQAFETLIRHKATMVVRLDDPLADNPAEQARAAAEAWEMPAPRPGIDMLATSGSAPGRILIDVREFRSPVPGRLYQHGFRIVPLTLPIGDYILTPQMAVERKTVSDLVSSLNSGRLFAQCEALCKAYRHAVLVIEFDEQRPFGFFQWTETSTAAATDADAARLLNASATPVGKLCLLTLHFPRLRLLWCHGAHATAEAFRALKANEDEPEESAALAAQPSAMITPADDSEAPAAVTMSVRDYFSSSAQDMLRHLPAVNAKNVFLLMRKFPDLAALAAADASELAEVLGTAGTRQLLRFLSQPSTGE